MTQYFCFDNDDIRYQHIKLNEKKIKKKIETKIFYLTSIRSYGPLY